MVPSQNSTYTDTKMIDQYRGDPKLKLKLIWKREIDIHVVLNSNIIDTKTTNRYRCGLWWKQERIIMTNYIGVVYDENKLNVTNHEGAIYVKG